MLEIADSFTSQTSSVAESIEERSDESASGERTPTYEDQAVDEGRIGSGACEVQPSSHADSNAVTVVDAQRPSTIGSLFSSCVVEIVIGGHTLVAEIIPSCFR